MIETVSSYTSNEPFYKWVLPWPFLIKNSILINQCLSVSLPEVNYIALPLVDLKIRA
jgi:hypothetical protein